MIRRSIMTCIAGVFILLAGCNPNKNGYERSESIKFDQYMYQGQQLYSTHCLNCHQKDGSGLGKLIPPLNTSFVSANKGLVICGIKNGIEGPISVNGVVYNHLMPGNSRLTPLEIAEIMTYISNTWGNEYGMVTIQQVKDELKTCN